MGAGVEALMGQYRSLAGATAVLLKQRPASTPHTNLIQSEA